MKNTSFHILFLPTTELVVRYFSIIMYIILLHSTVAVNLKKKFFGDIFFPSDTYSYVLCATTADEDSLLNRKPLSHALTDVQYRETHNWMSV